MSADIRQPFSSPALKRARETISLFPSDVSKCGELFVTNKADKWTFFCGYCEEVTSDIGVFICHIRLEHLNLQTDLAQQEQELLQQDQKIPNFIPELQHNSAEISEEFFTIVDLETREQYDVNTETIANDSDTISCYSPSYGDENDDKDVGDDIDFEMNDFHNATTNSKPKRKKMKPTLTDSADSKLKFKCPYCPSRYKIKSSLSVHISLNHRNKLKIKCEKCHRFFGSKTGLNMHLKSHDQDIFFKCSVCSTRHRESQFITHVLKHESDNCFPCQVCGKVYDSNEERLKHWNTHSKEKPFSCPICYLVFDSHSAAWRHKKIHKKYQCNFCAAEFSTTEMQQPPYICPACDKSGVKEKADGESRLENEKFIATPHHTAKTNENVFTTTPVRSEAKAQELISKTDSKKIGKVVNVENEAEYDANTETIENDQDDDVNISSSEGDANDDDSTDTDFEVNESHKSSSCGTQKEKSEKKTITSSADSKIRHRCPYCSLHYLNKRSITRHIMLYHQERLQFECKKCNRSFTSKNGLKFHQNYHNEHILLRCPICATEHTENQFTTHVLTHESDTCFPCQVCGKVHASPEARKRHWKTHAKEKRYPCLICYRRFDSRAFLARHKKSHI